MILYLLVGIQSQYPHFLTHDRLHRFAVYFLLQLSLIRLSFEFLIALRPLTLSLGTAKQILHPRDHPFLTLSLRLSDFLSLHHLVFLDSVIHLLPSKVLLLQ